LARTLPLCSNTRHRILFNILQTGHALESLCYGDEV
jgi:hypothetical protein